MSACECRGRQPIDKHNLQTLVAQPYETTCLVNYWPAPLILQLVRGRRQGLRAVGPTVPSISGEAPSDSGRSLLSPYSSRLGNLVCISSAARGQVGRIPLALPQSSQSICHFWTQTIPSPRYRRPALRVSWLGLTSQRISMAVDALKRFPDPPRGPSGRKSQIRLTETPSPPRWSV